MSETAGEEPDSVAVYGTLQRGASAWHLLEPLVVGYEQPTILPGSLYDTGKGYPALVPGEGPGVPAQVFQLREPASALPVLDRYEGPEYERVPMRLDSGTACWVYVWLSSVTGLRLLPNGWQR